MSVLCRPQNTLALTLAAAGLLAAASGALRAQTFARIGAGIYNDGGISAGVALADYDGDGHLDLFVANWNGQQDYLYRNNGDGSFSRVEDSPITAERNHSSGGAWGDYDGDGDLDLFVANQQNQHNCLFHNNGDGTFTKVTDGDIVSDFGDSYAGAWADYDRDGHLDLFVANSGQPNFLYRNNGDGSFTRIRTGEIVSDIAVNWSALWGDYDNDGDPDLFVPSVGQNNLLYRNRGDGSFEKIVDGEIVNDGGVSYGASWGDYDNDGDLDLFVANFVPADGYQNGLYRNNGDATFTRITTGDIVSDGGSPFGASWADYDNDGDLDLFEAIWGAPDHLYRNDGDGSFVRVTEGTAVGLAGFPSGHATGDFDNDGRIDLVLANWDNLNNYLLRNTSPVRSWLTVKLRGTESNRSGIGARVKATSVIDGREVVQVREMKTSDALRSQGGNRVHFGLGDATGVSRLEIAWPAGTLDTLTDIAADALITVEEGRGLVDRLEPDAPAAAAEEIGTFLYQPIVDHGVDAAIEQYRRLKRDEAAGFDFGDAQLNFLGYRLLGEGRSEAAIAIFRLNVEMFPDVLNGYDSLAEAYARTGDTAAAVATYRTLLEVMASDHHTDEQLKATFERTAGYYLKHFGQD